MADLSINIVRLLEKDPTIFSPQPDVYRVSFKTGNDPFRLRHVHKMAQIVAKVLLTEKGTDTFAPEIGTGIRSLVGRFVSKSNLPTIKRDIALWIADSERQLLEVQEDFAFPSDERLSKLVLLSAEFSFPNLSWTIIVRVITEAGDSTAINIGPQLERGTIEREDVLVRDVLTIDTNPLP